MIPHNVAQLAGFEIIGAAPAGGSARIFKSRHLETGQICALKLPEGVAGTDLVSREAELLRKLSHPSIVRLFDCGVVASTPWLATCWIDGRQVAELLKRGTAFDELQARGLFEQLASALDYAHSLGVVHADISPANIVLDSEDCATIVDFGIGRQLDITTVTSGSDFTGTLRYVAPEVIQGHKAGAAADQYATAVIVYELLTGCWPFDGDSSAAAALHSHLYAEPVSAQERNPAISSLMDQVLLKSLSKDPDARFDSMSAMAEALSDVAWHSETSGDRQRDQLTSPGEAPAIYKSVGKGMIAVGTVGVLSAMFWFQEVFSPGVNNSMVFSETRGNIINPGCNRLAAPETDDAGIVKNFYGVDGLPERITLISFSQDDWRLEIGKPNTYGLYGQILEVQSGDQYQLSAAVERNGYLHMPALRIEWLDAAYQVQPDLLMEYDISGLKDGLISMPAVEVPENAAYAVPTVYKDETEGSMIITSMFFQETTCR